MWTPSLVSKPAFLVSSRRNSILFSAKPQLSHAPPPRVPPPAVVMHAPPSGLPDAPTAVSGMNPFGGSGASGVRMMG